MSLKILHPKANDAIHQSFIAYGTVSDDELVKGKNTQSNRPDHLYGVLIELLGDLPIQIVTGKVVAGPDGDGKWIMSFKHVVKAHADSKYKLIISALAPLKPSLQTATVENLHFEHKKLEFRPFQAPGVDYPQPDQHLTDGPDFAVNGTYVDSLVSGAALFKDGNTTQTADYTDVFTCNDEQLWACAFEGVVRGGYTLKVTNYLSETKNVHFYVD